jgi:hypothetical protein
MRQLLAHTSGVDKPGERQKMKGLKGPLFWGNLGQNILEPCLSWKSFSSHLAPQKYLRVSFSGKIFSKTGKALEYFGFDVSAAVSQVSPEKQTLHFLPAAPTLV